MAIQKYKGHLALLGAAIMWGLMSPIGKTALENGISGLSLATFRMTGGAICFWIASIFAPKEQVKPHDLMMLFFAKTPQSGKLGSWTYSKGNSKNQVISLINHNENNNYVNFYKKSKGNN